MKLLFLDLETTGLSAERDTILEVGAVLFDIVEARVIWRQAWLYDEGYERFLPMDRYVFEMHTKSGLFADIDVQAGDSVNTAETTILRRLDADGFGPQQLQMAGYSPSFDRRFLAKHMPMLDAYLSHRMVDVSTLRTLQKAWGVPAPEKAAAHRALADCDEAIAELMGFRGLFAREKA